MTYSIDKGKPTIFLQTNSSYGSHDIVSINLHYRSSKVQKLSWRFKDWGYILGDCAPKNFSGKLYSVTGVDNRTWRITKEKDTINIECNLYTVLRLNFADVKDDKCLMGTDTMAYFSFDSKDNASIAFTKANGECINGYNIILITK